MKGQNVNKIQLYHPDPGKTAPRIDRAKYEIVKAALISIIPVDEDGIPFSELVELVESKLTQDELDYLGSVSWYTVIVKLDLEARNILQRVPNQKPQRVRRIRQNQ